VLSTGRISIIHGTSNHLIGRKKPGL